MKFYGFDLTAQKFPCPAFIHVAKFESISMVYRHMYQAPESKQWIGVYRCPLCGHVVEVARNKRGLVRRYRG